MSLTLEDKMASLPQGLKLCFCSIQEENASSWTVLLIISCLVAAVIVWLWLKWRHVQSVNETIFKLSHDYTIGKYTFFSKWVNLMGPVTYTVHRILLFYLSIKHSLVTVPSEVINAWIKRSIFVLKIRSMTEFYNIVKPSWENYLVTVTK